MKLKEPANGGRALTVACVLAVVLHIAVAPQLELFGGRINFMLIIAGIFAIMGDPHKAAVSGFCCGLCYDLLAAVPLGLMALLLTIATYVACGFSRGIQLGLNGECMRLLGIMFAIVNCVYGVLLFAMGVQTNLFWAIVGHGISSTILTLIMSVPFLMLASSSMPQSGFNARSLGTRFKGLH